VRLYFAECRYYTNFKSPYFRTAWDYGHMVEQAGSPLCIAHDDAGTTLTWYKFRIKVTNVLNFCKLYFSTSIAYTVLACSSKLMVDCDSMGPSLQLYGARFLNFSPVGGHVTLKFVKCWYHQNPLGFISVLPVARNLWLWLQVGRNKPCTLVAMTVSTFAGLFY